MITLSGPFPAKTFFVVVHRTPESTPNSSEINQIALDLPKLAGAWNDGGAGGDFSQPACE
jgi:hypothetical protein